MKNKLFLRQFILPLLAAFIWGIAFVFQKVSAEDGIQPFTFNSLRSYLGAIFLLFVLIVMKITDKRKNYKITDAAERKSYIKSFILGGTLCGIILTVAVNLQQIGIGGADTTGKAGFLTALYIVLVPIFSVIFTKRKVFSNVWISVFVALFGMCLLCIDFTQEFTVGISDLFLILCATCFAVHILLISHFTKKVNPIELSFLQFTVCAVVSMIIALFTEDFSFAMIATSPVSILYIGIFSSGVAYTLQMISEKDTNPTIVSLLFSLEAVFSLVAGIVYLHNKPSVQELFGCLLMFSAVIIVQLPEKLFKK